MDELKKEVYKLRKELRAKEKQLLEAKEVEMKKKNNGVGYIPSRVIVISEDDDGRTYPDYYISKPVDSDEYPELVEKLQWTKIDGGQGGGVGDFALGNFTLLDFFDGKVRKIIGKEKEPAMDAAEL